MRKLIINENEKKEILNKYKVGYTENKKIISEHERIAELMGVKPKRILLEDGGGSKYSWITEMPIMSGWKSTIDETPEMAAKLQGDMATMSKTLAANGVTPENIKSEAKAWFANYSKKLAIEAPMTEGDIIQLYIKKNYPAAINELNNKLTLLSKEGAEAGIDDIIKEMETDPDFAIRRTDIDESNSSDLASNKLGEDDMDPTTVDGVVKNTESAEGHFQGRVNESDAQINSVRQKAKDKGRTLSSAESDLITKLEKIREKYQKIVKYLKQKKQKYKAWQEAAEKAEKEGIGTGSKTADEVFTYAGKEYPIPAGLNSFQRFWWKGWVTRKLPLEFFNILGRLISMAYSRRTFTEQFMNSIVGMTAAIRKMDSEGVEAGKDIAKMAESELKAYAGRLYSELMASTGKKMDTEITFRSFFSDGFGGGAGKMDIQEAFNRLENMIKSVEGITEAEKEKIISQLYSRYMTSKGPVKDLGNFRGFMYFNEDLRSLGVKSSYIKEANEAAEAAVKGVDDGRGKVMDFLNEWFYGAAAKQNWKTLLGNMFKKLATGVLIGIPSGLKWVMRPILQRGLGFKSIAAIYFRLCLTKIAFVVSLSFIKFLVGLGAYLLLEVTRAKDITPLSGEEYAQECWDGMLNTIGDDALPALVPLHKLDIGWEDEQADLKAPFGKMKYNAKFGIFQSYGTEWFMEFKRAVFGKNSIDVAKEQQDAQQAALKELDDKAEKETEEFYQNMTPENKETIKKASGFNNVRDTILDPEIYPKMGMTTQETININQRLFFKPLFVGDIETIKQHGSLSKYLNSGKTLSTKDFGGFTFLCEKVLSKDKSGNEFCNGKSYRTVVCNDLYFIKDDFYKQYIYNEDTRQDGTMAKIYKGKFVYIKNEEFKEKNAISVGENCENIGLVTELPFI